MPKQVFVRVDNENGEAEYQAVDLNTLLTPDDLTEDLVRQTDLFIQTDADRRKNLEQAIKRKQRLQALEREEVDDETVTPPVPSIDPEAIINQAVQRVLDAQKQQQEAATARQQRVRAAREKNNLSSDVEALLAMFPEDRIDDAAQSLAALGLKFDAVDGANGSNEGSLDAEFADIDAALFGSDIAAKLSPVLKKRK